MNRVLIFIITIFSTLFCATAQEIKDITIFPYIDWSRKLVEEADDLIELQHEIECLNARCDSLRSSWNQVCVKYLNSLGNKYIDDIDYLIQNTDPAFDGQELYDTLIKARSKALDRRTDNGARPSGPIRKDEGYLDERNLKNLK